MRPDTNKGSVDGITGTVDPSHRDYEHWLEEALATLQTVRPQRL